MMRAAEVLRLRGWLLVTAMLLVWCGALNAQSFTVEQILSAPFPSQLTAAETGARVAWVFNLKGAKRGRGADRNGGGRAPNPTTETQQPKQQVWAMEVEGGHEPRLLGDMGCAFEGCEDIEISPDGKWAVGEKK